MGTAIPLLCHRRYSISILLYTQVYFLGNTRRVLSWMSLPYAIGCSEWTITLVGTVYRCFIELHWITPISLVGTSFITTWNTWRIHIFSMNNNNHTNKAPYFVYTCCWRIFTTVWYLANGLLNFLQYINLWWGLYLCIMHNPSAIYAYQYMLWYSTLHQHRGFKMVTN